MDFLNSILVKPFADMANAPDFLIQVLWEGMVSGVLYALIALGFVLIFKSSRIFNFAQGIMVVFAALTLVGLHERGVPALLAVPLTLVVMFFLAVGIERVVLVTSASHMPRSRWCFEQNGIEVIAAPVGFMGVPNGRPLNGWLPEAKAFWQNGMLLNEVVGMAIYPLVYRSAND